MREPSVRLVTRTVCADACRSLPSAVSCALQVYAVIVGNLSSLVMKQDDEIIAKRAQLELVQGYVRHIRVPKELKQRLTRFFQQRFKSTSLSAVPADVIYRGLPMEVQIEVSKHTNRAVIEAARILRGCSAGFVDRLSSLLQERTPEAESVIFRTAEACKELIFVASGVIELYDDHQPGEEASITETRSFGETLGDVPFVFQVGAQLQLGHAASQRVRGTAQCARIRTRPVSRAHESHREPARSRFGTCTTRAQHRTWRRACLCSCRRGTLTCLRPFLACTTS